MSMHLFANIATPFGTASNNRGETDGNTTTLQKLIWKSNVHTTVSAESIRFALRRLFVDEGYPTNRKWSDELHVNTWEDPEFKSWQTFIDDDLLGYMRADAAKDEAKAGSATIRRAPLEITRAVSLTPWHGDVSFNAASPGATPSAAKNKKDPTSNKQNPVPYGAEMHATRYQYGIALTPEKLADAKRAEIALKSLGALRSVAGNHGRFLYDFAPEAIVIRFTDDPAPRILYCFETKDDGATLSANALIQRLDAGDVTPNELFVGVSDKTHPFVQELEARGVGVGGVRQAIENCCSKIAASAK